jgi:ketosteroid isomerase-like protein
MEGVRDMRIEKRRHGMALERFAALAVVFVLALAVAACGDSADGDDDGSGSGAASTTGDTGQGTASDGGSPEEQIRASYARFADAILAENATALCSTMSPKVQRRTGGGEDCVKRMKTVFATGDSVKDKPTVTAVTITGNRAVAKVKQPDGRRTLVKYAKRDGEWLIVGYGRR